MYSHSVARLGKLGQWVSPSHGSMGHSDLPVSVSGLAVIQQHNGFDTSTMAKKRALKLSIVAILSGKLA